MSINDKITDSFKNVEIGKIFKRQEIIDKVLELYEVNESSIIPSDLCYNRANGNIDITKSNKLFEYIHVSSYKYLGPNYPYTGDVYTKKKKSREEVKVGLWNNGEYMAIIDLKAEEALINLEKHDYLDILEFLNIHAGEGYTNPEKVENKKEKDRCEQLKIDAKETIKKFKEIGNYFKKDGYSYDSNASTWLDGSNVKVRSYLWIELKKAQKEKFSTSISLVAEKQEELRFRVSLEIRDNKSEEKDYIRHFRYLNILDVYNTNFEYFGKTNVDLNNKDDINKWVNQVKNRSEMKLQIGRSINYDEVQSMSKEEIDKFFKNTVAELDRYYDEAVKEVGEIMQDNNSMSKNQILYGPPGTGKTYNAIYRALEIINRDKYKDIIEDSNKRDEAVSIFNQLLEDGQIAFCTFHQSYGYEEFVEGLRSSASGLGFEPKDGVFKHICERATGNKKARIAKYDFDVNKINFYKMSLGEKNVDDDIYEYCINNNYIALGRGGDVDYKSCKTIEDIRKEYLDNIPNSSVSDFDIDAIKRFKLLMKNGDIVIISDGNKMAKAIGKVIGDYTYISESEISYKHFRSVEWLYVGDSIDVSKILKNKIFSQQCIYNLSKQDINIDDVRSRVGNKEYNDDLCDASNNYVLVIDEINRGNISKIFGELITLIEEDKRIGAPNELRVTLPYSGNKFGVPSNLYILGTMNTADRSIALLDTALRRRFEFFEYMPNEGLLPTDVDGINVKEFLSIINKRIEYLFDREHTIGHAYFIKDNLDFDGLVSIMKNKVIPLLQEYFYGDYDKISLVLGGYTNIGKSNRFIVRENINAKELFRNNSLEEYTEQYKYSIVENPNKEAFLNIYTEVESLKED